jgi:multicomponent Na+:H+ antiporter subunit F
MNGTVPVEGAVLTIVFVMLCIAFGLSFVRLVIGPSLPDRALALDQITLLTIGFIGAYAIATDNAVLIDVAIALGLIAFMATVAFARFMERSTLAASRRDREAAARREEEASGDS